MKSRTDLASHKMLYAHDHEFVPDFISAVESLKPTVIIGVSGMPRTFDQKVLETMGRLNKQPVIFSLSNPTSKSECTARRGVSSYAGPGNFRQRKPIRSSGDGWQDLLPRPGKQCLYFPPGLAWG